MDDATAAARSANYLFDELAERIAKGPIKLRILVQLANEGDTSNDATVHWPEDRTLLELGTVVLTEPVSDNDHEQKHIIFDPIPRVDGIDPSDECRGMLQSGTAMAWTDRWKPKHLRTRETPGQFWWEIHQSND